ncbi:unnamed protein product [Lactuca virosa]|uniref:Uncharacterized protein n=1 Tax=Lactuca virosa TaxID=75947 RepID=A0AAU9PWF0_9ASTR|nr:unnamed protein product [Lactuca virosa]
MFDNLIRKQLWNRDNRLCYYSGPITVLLDSFITHVTGYKLENIEEFEVNADSLGMWQFIGREDDEQGNVSSDTDMELEIVEREFADEEDVASNEDAIENESDGIDEDTDTDENMLQKNA